MMSPHSQKTVVSSARVTLETPIDFDTFLSKLGAKDRINAEKHLAACEAEPDGRHATIWKRLVCALMTLAPEATKLNGQQSLQFYAPDGKYRIQVFAMEDLREGTISVYCTDVLDKAVKAKLVTAPKRGEEPHTYHLTEAPTQTITIERLDNTSSEPAAFYKHMLGWNRRALRLTLPSTATDAQVQAVEALCALSLQGMAAKTA